jgi:hypothetical protein
MHNCCLTAQQLAVTTDVDDYDNQLDTNSVGAILYEIAPGAPFLSRQQISNVMRAAAKYLKRGMSSDLTIMVREDGMVSFKIDLPGVSPSR